MTGYNFEELILEHARRVAEVIDAACEASLLSGKYGVRVVVHTDLSVTADVAEDVPYGHIQEIWERSDLRWQDGHSIRDLMAPTVSRYITEHSRYCPCGMPEAHLPGGKWSR